MTNNLSFQPDPAHSEQSAAGYLSAGYAESLREFGTPRRLNHCGGYVLQRSISGTSDHDAMGCYPLFCCQNWSLLARDIDELRGELVSLSLVPDPFGDFNLDELRRCFDVVIPFKEHFVADLRLPTDQIVSKHHQRSTRKGLRKVVVEVCEHPLDFKDEWNELYQTLIDRHQVKNIQTFSEAGFERQLRVPGLVMFRATHEEKTVGIDLCYVQGDVVYGHLAALRPEGYRLFASYALLWSEIEYFAPKARWLHLGGGAGVKSGNQDGLTEFKRGWSTETRMAYFCGAILNPRRYGELTNGRDETAYFPAYRDGEFA